MRCAFPVRLTENKGGDQFWTARRCGYCMPCRITKRQEWTLRLLLEARESKYVYFSTLTYSPEYLPEDGGLSKDDLQKFMKRFRKRLGFPVRYYAVGEYGEKTNRPHYHLVLFSNEEIPTEHRYRDRACKVGFWESPVIADSWLPGCRTDCIPLLGSDDREKSIRYVCGYVLKKLTKKERAQRPLEIFATKPEFAFMSKKPGIGAIYIDRIVEALWRHKVFPANSVVAGLHDVAFTSSMQFIRVGGKKYPTDRYLKEKIIKRFGGDRRSERLKRLLVDMREIRYVQDEEYKQKQDQKSKDSQHRAAAIEKRRKSISGNF